MGNERPKKIHPFFERARPSNVIVPRLDPASPHKLPSTEQHGSEAECDKPGKRKLKKKSLKRGQLTPVDTSSAEASECRANSPTSNEDDSKPRRNKRRKGTDNARLPFKPEPSIPKSNSTILSHISIPAALGKQQAELPQDTTYKAETSTPGHASSSTPCEVASEPDGKMTEPDKHQTTPPPSSPPRKLIKLHLSGKLLSSPILQSAHPSTPDPTLEENLGTKPLTPELPHKKELRLNANGKLLSSPPKVQQDTISEIATETKRPTRSSRRKSTRLARNAKKDHIVRIKYGSDESSRIQIGQLIEAILKGEPDPQPTALATIPNTEVQEQNPPETKKPTPPPQPPKPTHPFFLPKSAQEATTPAPAEVEKKPLIQEPPPPKPSVVKPPLVQLIKSSESEIKPPPVKVTGTWPAFRTKSPRNPDAKYALWPFREGVHVRGLGSEERPTYHDFDIRYKKGKGKTFCVDNTENVLSLISMSLQEIRHDHESRTRSILRYPRQQHWTGRELETIVGNRLRTIHSAVVNSREEIKDATTAFDMGSCEDNMWTVKYAPSSTEDVLQNNDSVTSLSEWLKKLVVYTVQKEAALNGKSRKSFDKDKKKKKKKKKRKPDLAGFIASDDSTDEADDLQSMIDGLQDSEDELGLPITTLPKRMPIGPPKKAILVTGPTGCGKTASVYAAAKELGFEVFEVNAGSKRSGKDILERVGDMARNHLVQLEKQLDGAAADGEKNPEADSNEPPAPGPTKQKTMASFFKITAPKQKSTPQPEQKPVAQPMQTKSKSNQQSLFPAPSSSSKQKQSLILLDDVDILFEEDKQFWTGVSALLEHSKRPVIMTCTNESLVPIDELELEEIVRMTPPPSDIVADYCLTIAAKEGHLLKSEDIEGLYLSLGKDLRATLTTLNFWCQMGVGSEKAGLDWLPDARHIFGKEVNKEDVSRTISEGDYVDGMQTLNHDIAVTATNLEKDSELKEECLKQWSIGVMDWEERRMIEDMRQKFSHDAMDVDAKVDEWTTDMRSCLDIFCGESLETPFHDQLDASWPEISVKQRSNYTETYPLVQADPRVEYSSLTTKIGSAFSVLLHRYISKDEQTEEQVIMELTKRKASDPSTPPISRSDLYTILEPLGREDLTIYNALPGRQSFSLDREVSATAEDVAPYIRSIVFTDEESVRRREEFIREDQENNPKRRTTRASLAAAEDGTISRRENYFTRHNELVPAIFDTASVSWKQALESYMRNLPPVTDVPVFERDWKWVVETPEDYGGM